MPVVKTLRSLIILLAAAAAPGAPAERPSGGEPVIIEGREVARVWEATPPYTLAERAMEIQRRIEMIAERSKAERIPITTIESGLGTVLLTGSVHLMVVTDLDAKGAGAPRAEVAARYANSIQEAVFSYKRSHSWVAYLISVAKSAGAWLVFILLCWLAIRGFRTLENAIQQRIYGQPIPGPGKGVTRLLWEKMAAVALLAMKAAVGLFLLFQLSFVISFTFSLFPQTAGISTTFLDYLTSTVGAVGMSLLEYLPRGGFVIVVGFFAYYINQVIRVLAVSAERGDIHIPGVGSDVARPTYQLVRIGIVLFALVIVYPYLPGGQSEAFKGITLFLGVLVSLSSGSVVANLFAGIVLTYMRPYKMGDRILVGNTLGEVIHKNLLVTRLRTFKNEEVVIPNSTILNGQILNYSAFAKNEGFILNTTVTIGYDAPWRKVHEIMLEAARRTDGVLSRPEPFVLQKAMNDFHVSYQLNAYSDRPEEWEKLYSRLHQNIQDCFNEAGVEIMSPTYLSLRDGNTVTTPADYRPPDYDAPSFRVNKQA
jgi:small-conductance mechanosensitive channel